jgi:crotonobetainyl-CoA:carnitine CoA-transferase CaiB-like acyl-CoA transferase
MPCRTLAEVREVSRQLMRANESNPDPNTSVIAASAVLMALLARERSGVAQAVYVNMLAANMYANADDALAYAGKPERVTADDDLLGFDAGYRLYETAAGWLFLAARTDAEWRGVADVLGQPDLAGDPRFASADARAANDAALADVVAAALARRSADEWEVAFVAAGVAGVRADETTPGPFFAHHPQMQANGFAPDCTHTRFGVHRRWGPIVRVNGGLDRYLPGVLAGEQTTDILQSLGRTPDEITSLYNARVVASEPVETP